MKSTSKFTHIIASVLAVFTLGLAGLIFIPTAHAISADICTSSASTEVKAANGCYGNAGGNIQNAVTVALNAIIGALGIVAVIFIVVGGVNYMTSAGDAGKVEKAKKTILYAAIGLIICALSFAIVNFIIGGILGQS